MTQEIFLYRAQQKIYPRSVGGVFARWRWGFVWLTQVLFYGLPWLPWGDRQAVLFDIAQRRFYIFKLVLYPQDFIYLAALLVISALSLFLFTAVAGRLWCGYTCPQTVYTEMFMWLERHIEGDRMARMRRDAAGWTWGNVARKSGKHAAWLLLAFWTGFSFVGYFTPIHVLSHELLAVGLGSYESVWVVFYGFATYGNAGFMREQVCKHMCPYARFQSAMFDKDTLIVTYDEKRGEPRGARSKKADLSTLNLGACVDVCDTVMDKVGYPRGLVKYTTENAMAKGWTQSQTLRHVLRPRVLVYTGILSAIVLAMVVSLSMRTLFKVNVVRDRGVMAREVEDGKIENVYRLQVMNATEATQRYKITVGGLPGLAMASETIVTIASTEARVLAVRVQAPANVATPGSHPMQFEIDSLDSPGHLTEKSIFMVPR